MTEWEARGHDGRTTTTVAIPAEAVNWGNVRALVDRLDEEIGHPEQA